MSIFLYPIKLWQLVDMRINPNNSKTPKSHDEFLMHNFPKLALKYVLGHSLSLLESSKNLLNKYLPVNGLRVRIKLEKGFQKNQ